MSIFRDCDTCGHDFRDADDSPCASADDVETGCTGWVPSGAMEVALWKRKAREMAKDARWWRRRRERQLSHIDRAKEEVALQRHRGLRHWAKWVKRGEEIAELRAELEARAEVITGLQAALVEMRERQKSDTDESSTGYAHLDMIVTAHNRGHVSQRMIDDAAAWLDENERMPEPTP